MTDKTANAGAHWAGALASPDARFVLRQILFVICEMEKGAMSADAPTPDYVEPFGPVDPMMVAYRDGRRSIGRQVRAVIESVDRKGYVGLLSDDITESGLPAS